MAFFVSIPGDPVVACKITDRSSRWFCVQLSRCVINIGIGQLFSTAALEQRYGRRGDTCFSGNFPYRNP